MIVRNIKDIENTEKEVKAKDGQWVSKRMLLASDRMGFSFHETIIKAGSLTNIHYKNHLEAVYCVGGNGSIYNCETKEQHAIHDGIMYALDENDKHILYGGNEDMRLICVFNPPLTGKENHDKDGAYPLIEE